MSKDKKKAPKTNNDEYIVSSDAEAVLYGLLLILLGAIGLINKGPIGHFITYAIVYLFGVFYSLFFILMIFFGLYLIIKKKFYALKIDLKLLGAILLLFSFSIGASLVSEFKTIEDAFMYFSENMKHISQSGFYIESLTEVSLIGGGVIGYFFVGLFNQMFTIMGTKIILVITLVVGVFLLCKDLLIKFSKFVINFHENRKKIRKEAKKERDLKDAEQKSIENLQKLLDEERKNNKNNSDLFKEDNIVVRDKDNNVSSFFEEIEVDNKKDLKDSNEEDNIFDSTDKNNEELNKNDKVDLNILNEDLRKVKPIEVSSFFEEIDDVNKNNSNGVIEKNNKVDYKEEKIIKSEQLSLFDKDDNNIDEVKNTTYNKIVKEVKDEIKIVKKTYVYPPISLLTTLYDGDKTAQNIQIADEYVNMDEFWDADTETAPRAVDVYMTKLRGKLADCEDFEIKTVHGLGYKAVIK